MAATRQHRHEVTQKLDRAEEAPSDRSGELPPTRDVPAPDDVGFYLKGVAGRHPLLAPAEERALARRARAGDSAARERLIVSNLRLVFSIAKHYQGHGVPLLDLTQEGTLGLMHAIEKFEPERGLKLSTYATWWIKQAVQRGAAHQGRTVRVPINRAQDARALRHAEARLRERGIEPTAAQLAAATGLELADVQALRSALAPIVPLDQPTHDNGGSSLSDFLADDDRSEPGRLAALQMQQESVRTAVARLPKEQREVIELRFGLKGRNESSLAKAAAVLRISRDRVRELERRALVSLARNEKLTDR